MFLRWRSCVKFHKLPHLTSDVTGQHFRQVLSDVSLPRLSERRRRLKFRLRLIWQKLEQLDSFNVIGLYQLTFCLRTATRRISFFQILLVFFTFFFRISFLSHTEINIVRWKKSLILHFSLQLFHFKYYRSGCWSRWENLGRGKYPFQPIKFMNLVVPMQSLWDKVICYIAGVFLATVRPFIG